MGLAARHLGESVEHSDRRCAGLVRVDERRPMKPTPVAVRRGEWLATVSRTPGSRGLPWHPDVGERRVGYPQSMEFRRSDASREASDPNGLHHVRRCVRPRVVPFAEPDQLTAGNRSRDISAREAGFQQLRSCSQPCAHAADDSRPGRSRTRVPHAMWRASRSRALCRTPAFRAAQPPVPRASRCPRPAVQELCAPHHCYAGISRSQPRWIHSYASKNVLRGR